MVKFKIADDEKCPCGSGILFVECCRGKKNTISLDVEKPVEVKIMEMMRKAMVKCCMHPDRSKCNGKIKAAHALQNNKIISLLAGADRHVYMMNPKKIPIIIPLEDGNFDTMVEMDFVSANKATTETCFCDRHDNIAFAAIEKGAPDFDVNNQEMKFVYAYKTFIFENYKKWMEMKIYMQCFAKAPQVFQMPEMVAMYRSIQMSHDEIEPIKAHFDKEIIEGTHNGVETCIVELKEQLKFANYAYIAPEFDLNGKKIKHTIKGVMHRLSVTVIPEEKKSYILLSCLSTELFVYKKFFDQLSNAPLDKIKYYISMILPLYSENMVLSPKIWKSWDEEAQMAYTFYANLKGPEVFQFATAIGMGLRNAARTKNFDYSKRGKIDLFN